MTVQDLVKRLALAMLVTTGFALFDTATGLDTDLISGWFAAFAFYRVWQMEGSW